MLYIHAPSRRLAGGGGGKERAARGGVLDRVDVHRALVREPEEEVVRFHRGLAALLAAEDEVDPTLFLGLD